MNIQKILFISHKYQIPIITDKRYNPLLDMYSEENDFEEQRNFYFIRPALWNAETS